MPPLPPARIRVLFSPATPEIAGFCAAYLKAISDTGVPFRAQLFGLGGPFGLPEDHPAWSCPVVDQLVNITIGLLPWGNKGDSTHSPSIYAPLCMNLALVPETRPLKEGELDALKNWTIVVGTERYRQELAKQGYHNILCLPPVGWLWKDTLGRAVGE